MVTMKLILYVQEGADVNARDPVTICDQFPKCSQMKGHIGDCALREEDFQ